MISKKIAVALKPRDRVWEEIRMYWWTNPKLRILREEVNAGVSGEGLLVEVAIEMEIKDQLLRKKESNETHQ